MHEHITDTTADDAVLAMTCLAQIVRLGDLDRTAAAAQRAIDAAGDPVAAVAIAAAMIRLGTVDRWWSAQRPVRAHVEQPGHRRAEVQRLLDAGVQGPTIARLMREYDSLQASRMGRAS